MSAKIGKVFSCIYLCSVHISMARAYKTRIQNKLWTNKINLLHIKIFVPLRHF
jgi:hypothetical protein